MMRFAVAKLGISNIIIMTSDDIDANKKQVKRTSELDKQSQLGTEKKCIKIVAHEVGTIRKVVKHTSELDNQSQLGTDSKCIKIAAQQLLLDPGGESSSRRARRRRREYKFAVKLVKLQAEEARLTASGFT